MSLSEPREWMQFANLPELSAQFVSGGHRPQILTYSRDSCARMRDRALPALRLC
jgi:hypothetical protein